MNAIRYIHRIERESGKFETFASKIAMVKRPPKKILGQNLFDFIEMMSIDNCTSEFAGSASNVNAVVALLREATSGMLFTSESDYHMTIFQLSPSSSMPQTITIENAKSVFISTTNIPSDIHSSHRQDWTSNIAVEEKSLDWFFGRYTIAQDWWEPSQQAELPRWKHVLALLNQNISDVQVFRIGQANDSVLYGSIDVFILGQCQCDPLTWVGIHTISVET